MPQNIDMCLKALTHRPILRGLAAESAVESADSIPESTDSKSRYTIMVPLCGMLSHHMFDYVNILIVLRLKLTI